MPHLKCVSRLLLAFGIRPTRFASTFVVNPPKKRAPGHTSFGFVNLKRVLVEAGNGGDGCIAFEHLFCNPNGGPSGGDGGNGGHVILQASSRVTDLSHVPSIIRAEHGAQGRSENRHGASASHTVIQVPIGTTIYDIPIAGDSDPANGVQTPTETLSHEDSLFIAARGGAGGKGNAFLTNASNLPDSNPHRSCRNTPLRVAERGACGQQRRLILRMSSLAEIGLVGMPNAGKSTLLRRLTRARPKVAPYAFTTLKPHMGVLRLNMTGSWVDDLAPDTDTSTSFTHDLDHITIADLPGLLPGAAEENRGLGAQFLTLITECRLLAYVVDIGTIWTQATIDPIHTLREQVLEQLAILRHELITFDARLPDPERSLVIGTKIDLILDPDRLDNCSADNFSNSLIQVVSDAAVEVGVLDPKRAGRVVLVSARRGDNVASLVEHIRVLSKRSTEVPN